MRTIKFRAWNKQIKKMAYDVQNEYDTIAGIRYWVNSEITDQEPNCTSFGEYLDDSETWDVMQYTGLKDKNGKEIYEGDICKITGGNYKYQFEIVWEEQTAGFSFRQVMGGVSDLDFMPDYLNWNEMMIDKLQNIEVIGDIYSNPGLLK